MTIQNEKRLAKAILISVATAILVIMSFVDFRLLLTILIAIVLGVIVVSVGWAIETLEKY